MISFKEKLLAAYLNWQSRPGKIKKYLSQKSITPSANCRHINPEMIRVAAVQLEMQLVKDPLQFAHRMYEKVREAVQNGAQLVVFPEDNASQLLGLLPGIEKIARRAENLDAALGQLGPDLQVADIFGFLGPYIKSIFLTTFSTLAGGFQVYINGGSSIFPTGEGRVVNEAFLLGPDGRLLGSQKKTHLLPLEGEWGLTPDCCLEVFETPLGNIACPVCMDATYFEPFRILYLLGADIVTLPIANPEEYNFWKALRGIWPRVQESPLYAIKSAMVGNRFLGFKFTGRSGVYAPLELTADKDGVIAEATSFDKEEIVYAELDILKLRAYRQTAEVTGDVNMELYQKYFPQIYDILPSK